MSFDFKSKFYEPASSYSYNEVIYTPFVGRKYKIKCSDECKSQYRTWDTAGFSSTPAEFTYDDGFSRIP